MALVGEYLWPLTVASLAIKQMYGKRTSRRPTASDLRDSGQISYDADSILFMWKPIEADESYRQLIVAYSRHSSQMKCVDLYFDEQNLTFSETLQGEGQPLAEPPPKPGRTRDWRERLKWKAG